MYETNNTKKATAIKLLLYTLFVAVVSIFAISNRKNVSTSELEDREPKENKISEEEIELNNTIEIPNEYNYKINITINEEKYKYTGTKNFNMENITKEVDGITSNYIYENDNYYKDSNGEYTLTSKDEIYDIIDSNYLDLKTINTYLSKSIKDQNQYLIYIKDIMLGNDSQDYIIINLINNEINIDYTSLMKKFNKTIEKYYVKIEIEEKE